MGEGPRQGQQAEQTLLKIGTVNSTHWSTFVKANLWAGEGGESAAAWCLQETKLIKNGDIRQARSLADRKNWGLALDKAVRTKDDGVSSGTGVAWNRHIASGMEECSKFSEQGRWTVVRLKVGQLQVAVASFYGDCRSPARTRSLLEELLTRLAQEPLWVIGGDFNLGAEDVREVSAGSGGRVVAPPGPTCRSSHGGQSTIDFFVVSPAAERLTAAIRCVESASIKTHVPVVLSLRCGGEVAPLTRWVRPPVVASSRVLGPHFQAALPEELMEVLSADSWKHPEVGQVV